MNYDDKLITFDGVYNHDDNDDDDAGKVLIDRWRRTWSERRRNRLQRCGLRTQWHQRLNGARSSRPNHRRR